MSSCDGVWFVNNKSYNGKRALYASDTIKDLKVIGNTLECNDDSDYGIKIVSENAIIIGNTVNNEAETGNIIDPSAVVVGNIGVGE